MYQSSSVAAMELMFGAISPIQTECDSIQWHAQEFCSGGGGCSTDSVDRGQRAQGPGGGSPLVSGSAQFANEWNLYSY
jgi:hypothetical protein